MYGQSARRIQVERRATGEFVHVELGPGVVTILPAWKLDAVYCAGLKVGAPQVSLAALCALHELLIACESRPVSADGNIVTQEAQLLPLARRTEPVPRLKHTPPTAPRQLDLVFDDVRLRGMTPAERQTALRSLAHLLLEASGIAPQEAGDDDA